MNDTEIRLRPAQADDLEALNQVVADAIATWDLPERVKRLSLPVYRYTRQDLAHLDMVVARDQQGHIVGVAAWEEADPRDAPAGQRALLLHGIYVDPSLHRRGIGGRLFSAAEAAVGQRQCDGLLVKAQQDATGFFISRGMCRLDVDEPLRQYGNRLWKELTQAHSADCR